MITNHKYVYIAHITAISDDECTAYVPAFKEVGYATEIKADSITNALDALNDKVVKILVECENENKLPPDEVVKLKEQPEHGAFTFIQPQLRIRGGAAPRLRECGLSQRRPDGGRARSASERARRPRAQRRGEVRGAPRPEG